MEKFRNKVEMTKLWLAISLIVFGCITLTAGFIVAPAGVIHQSVLIAFGEISTLAGSILGLNYAYQSKVKYLEMELDKKQDKVEETK